MNNGTESGATDKIAIACGVRLMDTHRRLYTFFRLSEFYLDLFA